MNRHNYKRITQVAVLVAGIVYRTFRRILLPEPERGIQFQEVAEVSLSFTGAGAALCSTVLPVHGLPRYLYEEIKWPGSDDSRSHTRSVP